MKIIEDAIEIRGNDGLIRRGIMTTPTSKDRADIGILLLPAGLKYRIGPQRFYVSIARYLANKGYSIFRFDPLGLGESDGELPLESLSKIYNSVEQGSFTDDALLAAETMKKHFGIKKVIAGGICGGALTSQLAAVNKKGIIDGILSINTSVSIDGAQVKDPMVLGDAQMKKNYQVYLKKTISLQAWSRIFKGKSNFIEIYKTMYTLLVNKFSKKKISTILEPLSNENPNFIKSFLILEQLNIKHMLLYSENDDYWNEFQDIILNRYLNGRLNGKGYTINIIPDADHVFSLPEWQQQAMDKIYDWLLESFQCSNQNSTSI